MNTRPEVSDQEIRGFMDFEGLLERRKGVVESKRRVDLIRKSVIISISVIMVSVVWFLYRGNQQKDAELHSVTETNPPTKDRLPLSDSSYALPETINPPGKGNAMGESRENTKEQKAPNERSVDATPEDKLHQDDVETPVGQRHVDTRANPGNYNFIEAEPVDGYPALYEYFSRELRYPGEGVKDSVQGVVTVSFVIGTTGNPEKIQIEHSLGEAFDREAVRLIRNMPAWKPATVNGNPLPTKLSVPLTFQMQKVKIIR